MYNFWAPKVKLLRSEGYGGGGGGGIDVRISNLLGFSSLMKPLCLCHYLRWERKMHALVSRPGML